MVPRPLWACLWLLLLVGFNVQDGAAFDVEPEQPVAELEGSEASKRIGAREEVCSYKEPVIPTAGPWPPAPTPAPQAAQQLDEYLSEHERKKMKQAAERTIKSELRKEEIVKRNISIAHNISVANEVSEIVAREATKQASKQVEQLKLASEALQNAETEGNQVAVDLEGYLPMTSRTRLMQMRIHCCRILRSCVMKLMMRQQMQINSHSNGIRGAQRNIRCLVQRLNTGRKRLRLLLVTTCQMKQDGGLQRT